MLLQRGPGQSLDAKTFPCILGPVDRCIGHLTEVGWPVQWCVGLGYRGRGWRAGAVPRSWRRCGASELCAGPAAVALLRVAAVADAGF